MELNQDHIFVIVLLMSVTVGGTVGLKCRMESFQTCPSYDLISTKNFQGFISLKNFNTQCRNMKMALECAQSSSYLEGCDDRDLLEYNMVKNLQKAICEQFKTEYKNNARCIMTETVKYGVENCLNEMSMQEYDLAMFCRSLGEGLKCVQHVVGSAGDGYCVADVLVKIISSYLMPLGKLYKCPGYEETTTATTTSLITTTFRSSSVPATTMTTSTSDRPLLLVDTAGDGPVRFGESRNEINSGLSRNKRSTYQHLTITVCFGFFNHFVRNLFRS